MKIAACHCEQLSKIRIESKLLYNYHDIKPILADFSGLEKIQTYHI